MYLSKNNPLNVKVSQMSWAIGCDFCQSWLLTALSVNKDVLDEFIYQKEST